MSNARRYKLAFIGSQQSGKTSLVSMLVNPNEKRLTQHKPTIGAALATYKHPNDQSIQFEVWDISGDLRFASLIQLYTRQSNLILLAMNSQSSDDEFNSELKFLRDQIAKIDRDASEFMLVFTKADNENVKPSDDRIQQAKLALNVNDHLVCSAKATLGIEDLRLLILYKAVFKLNQAVKNTTTAPEKTAVTEQKIGFWDNQIAASKFWSRHKTAFKILSIVTLGAFLGLYKVSQCLTRCTSSSTPTLKINSSTNRLPFPQHPTMHSQNNGDEDITFDMMNDGNTLKKPFVLPLTQQQANNPSTLQRQAKL